MSINTLNDIKKGMILNYAGDPYSVLEAKFVRMQQRKPVMQCKLKNIINGKVIEYSFKSGETPTEADVEKRKGQYLYSDENSYCFMDEATFDQCFLAKDQVGVAGQLLKDGQRVDIAYFNGNAVTVALPPKVELKVVTTMDAVKGNTASGNVLKDATLETGFVARVPLFIKEGDIVRINTDTLEYTDRVGE